MRPETDPWAAVTAAGGPSPADVVLAIIAGAMSLPVDDNEMHESVMRGWGLLNSGLLGEI